MRIYLLTQITTNPLATNFFESAVVNLTNQNYIAKNIDIEFKDMFGNSNNDPRFKGISSW